MSKPNQKNHSKSQLKDENKKESSQVKQVNQKSKIKKQDQINDSKNLNFGNISNIETSKILNKSINSNQSYLHDSDQDNILDIDEQLNNGFFDYSQDEDYTMSDKSTKESVSQIYNQNISNFLKNYVQEIYQDVKEQSFVYPEYIFKKRDFYEEYQNFDNIWNDEEKSQKKLKLNNFQ